jgi:hypothetical protein
LITTGDFKQSGNGRGMSIHAFYDYTELKTTWIELIQTTKKGAPFDALPMIVSLL